MKRDNLRISEGIKYTGEALDGLPHGKGTMTYPDGQVYVGEFKDGNCHGQGTMTNPNGSSYVGEFKNNKMHGQGTEIMLDGAKYVGEFKNNMLDGKGIMTYSADESPYNKSRVKTYEGEWKEGKQHGQGTMIYFVGAKYVGEFKDYLFHGKGTLTYPEEGPDNESGRGSYEGEWKEGKQHGQGTLLYLSAHEHLNGAKYVGEFKDNMLHGQGKWTDDFNIQVGVFWKDYFSTGNEYHPEDGNLEAIYKDGVYHEAETASELREFTEEDGSKFEGIYRKGKRISGALMCPDGSFYYGKWKDDLFHGQGTYTYPDKSTYEGEWKEGKKHGQGTWKSESFEYVGEWKDGEQHGQGTEIYTDDNADPDDLDGQSTYVGEFKDGLPDGGGTETWGNGDKDGNKYIGEWKKGEKWEGIETDKDGNVTATYSEGDATYSEGVKTEK